MSISKHKIEHLNETNLSIHCLPQMIIWSTDSSKLLFKSWQSRSEFSCKIITFCTPSASEMQHYLNGHKQMFNNIANTPCNPPPQKKTSLCDRQLQGRFDNAAVITGVRMNTDRPLLITEYQLTSKLFGIFSHQALILCLTVTCNNNFTSINAQILSEIHWLASQC